MRLVHYKYNSMQGLLLEKRFRVEKKIGSGAFGEIWQCFDEKEKETRAIKFENVDMKKQQLFGECNIYIILQNSSLNKKACIPRVYFYGSEHGKNFLVMDMLGNSLDSLLKSCGGKFSIKTTTQIALQMLETIEFLHNNRIIHRDIKPDNMMTSGNKNDKRIYLVDFGLAKKYKNSKHEHIMYREGKGLTGTARYVSINTHLGIE